MANVTMVQFNAWPVINAGNLAGKQDFLMDNRLWLLKGRSMRTRLSNALRLTSTDTGRLLKWSDITKIALWPVLATLSVVILWAVTQSRIEEERAATGRDAMRQANAFAASYADQLTQTVQQLDQITLMLKYNWEDRRGQVNIEKMRMQGLFPNSTLLFASIIDSNGMLVTSSLETGVRADFSYAQFFQEQKAGCCSDLLISTLERGVRLGLPVIRFSRRLNQPDGTFDGVAFVSVVPSYLLSFQNEGLSPHDFISARLTSGPLLATRLGSKQQAQIFYRTDPMFVTDSGVVLEPAEKFKDGRPRIVAWMKLQKYPLVALAGLSEEDALAPFRAMAQSHRQSAMLGTFLLVLLTAVGMYFSTRLAWRRRREEDVRATYRLATDAAREGFFIIEPVYDRNGVVIDFRLEDCNEHGAELVGQTRASLIGQCVSQLQPKQYRNEIFEMCTYALEHGVYEREVRVARTSPVKAKWIYRRISHSSSGLALTVRDISDTKEHEEALSNLANSDMLTQLPNRRWLSNYLPNAIQRSEHAHKQLAVLFIDLDNFKNINDTLGHEAGDELLQQAARRLKHAVRASDYVVRLGGDEFTVILENLNGTEDVTRLAKGIISALSESFELSAGTGNRVNASIGISIYPQDGVDGDTLLKNADLAMYAAKSAGKGRFCFYTAQLSDVLLLRMSKEHALREAVDHDEFVVHYQPRVGVNSGKLTSMEALVRWKHSERGLVYPLEFIDIAEDIGLIGRLGELVIEKVFAQLSDWKRQGLAPVPVSINVSPRQLKTGTVSSFITSCIEKYGVDSSLIEVELTESAVVERSQVVSHELAALRQLGVKLMIDDFGTGYSSLAQLHRLDIDALKVDRAFTHELCNGTEGQTIFRAIVSMADALDICVVAEGVETSEQVDVLRSLSCDEIQGFFISKAIAANEIQRFMLQRAPLPTSSTVPQPANLSILTRKP